MDDYYKILQVSPEADQEMIESAYRTLAKKYHPDVDKSPGAEERFKKINEAYNVLGSPYKRGQYDVFYRLGDLGVQQPRPAPQPVPEPNKNISAWKWFLILLIVTKGLALIGYFSSQSRLWEQEQTQRAQVRPTRTPSRPQPTRTPQSQPDALIWTGGIDTPDFGYFYYSDCLSWETVIDNPVLYDGDVRCVFGKAVSVEHIADTWTLFFDYTSRDFLVYADSDLGEYAGKCVILVGELYRNYQGGMEIGSPDQPDYWIGEPVVDLCSQW